jgi:maleylpyruvate isomerase
LPSTPDLAAVADATERLLATARALTDADVDAPSLLPGWTVGHVLTHVARNADGNRRMAEGAARGVVLDQYEGGAEGRAADIAAGARRPTAEQVADLEESARRLAGAWAAMPEHAWRNHIRPFGGERPASDGPVSRRFEVEVHHVDLGLDAYGPRDWPASFVDLGLERVVRLLRRHAATIGPPATWRVSRTDGDLDVTVRRDLFGTTVATGPFEVDPDAVVRARGADLLAWLLGRRVGVPGDVDGDAAVAALLPAAYPWQ